MQKAVVGLVVLALILLLFGCTASSSLDEVAKKNPQVKEFLESHPDAQISIRPYTFADLQNDSDLSTLGCSSDMLIDAYYLATIEDANATYKALFDKANMNLACGVVKNHPVSSPANTNPNLSETNNTQKTTPTQKPGTTITNPCNSIDEIITCNSNETCVEEIIATYRDINYNCGCSKCTAIATNNQTQTCAETWFCGDWGACEDNSQTRTCIEINECGTIVNKPTEQQECESQQPVGLILYYDFDEEYFAGGKITDKAGDYNATRVTLNPYGSDTSQGVKGNALNMRGEPTFNEYGTVTSSKYYYGNNYWKTPSNPIAGLNSFTISLWFNYANTYGINAKLASIMRYSGEKSYGLVIGTHSTDAWDEQGSSIFQNTCSRNISFNPNQWNNLVIVYTKNYLKEYVNGQLASNCATNGNLIGAGNELDLGNAWTGIGYKGLIDEFRIYNRTINQEKVTEIYQEFS